MKPWLVLCIVIMALGAPIVLSAWAEDQEQTTIARQLSDRRVAYRDALKDLVEITARRYREGTDSIDEMLKAQLALMEAELEIAASAEDRIAVLEESLSILKEAEEHQKVRVQNGTGRAEELVKSRVARIRGEIALLQERERQSR